MVRLLSCVVVVVGISSCIGVSQKRAASGQASPSLQTCPTGIALAADGLIDDFEDENTQATPLGGRDGFWWTKKDPVGSTLLPESFGPTEGGADGSEFAIHVYGKTAMGADAWGAGFGVNFKARKGGLYDASRYAGISFKARVGAQSTRNIRFQLGDVNTHPDADVCKTCWNHFGKDFTFTTQWKEYRVLFSEASQRPGWGDPRPPSVDPTRLVAIDWSISEGQTYDLWVDDVTFIGCR